MKKEDVIIGMNVKHIFHGFDMVVVEEKFGKFECVWRQHGRARRDTFSHSEFEPMK